MSQVSSLPLALHDAACDLSMQEIILLKQTDVQSVEIG